MTIFIQNDATGAGAGTVRADLAFVHLAVIANLDTGVGLNAAVGNLQQVTYARTDPGVPATRLDTLVNTNFGVNAAGTDIIVLAVGGDFTLIDGSLITTRGGTALPPAGSGQPGADLNTTTSCLVLYDTGDNNGSGYCLARQGTGGVLDLRLPLSVMLHHELSHAFRIVTNALLALSAQCNPASPEENAAITDENDMRTQLATLLGDPVVLRDPNIHCGTTCGGGGGGGGECCIVASVSSGSPLSTEVQELRALREQFLRRSEVGFAFFDTLHHSYYGFSPQVVDVMATDLELRAVTLDGFVRPLIRMLQLVRDHTLDGACAAQLGRRFCERLTPAEVPRTLEVMDRMGAVLGLGVPSSGAPSSEGRAEVARLVATRALPDPHLQWGLLEPVQAYHDLLRAWRDGVTDDTLGTRVVEFIDGWAGRLPIAPHWGMLTVERVRAELAWLAGTLLRDSQARAEFRRRLRGEFGAVTAVQQALNEEEVPR
ncbi:MAG: hypothetical protein ACRC35_13265 [Angustibacter sp.]